jgi:hypothetical protein
MRLNKPANNPLSICRNFGGFEGIYEQEFNARAMRFPCGPRIAPTDTASAPGLSRGWHSVILAALQ